MDRHRNIKTTFRQERGRVGGDSEGWQGARKRFVHENFVTTERRYGQGHAIDYVRRPTTFKNDAGILAGTRGVI